MGDGAGGGDGNVVDGSVDGGGCPRGKCPVPLTAATGPQRIAVAPDAVYWTTATDLGRVGLDGSGALTKQVVGGAIVANLNRGVAVEAAVPYVTVGDRGAAKCTAATLVCTNTPFIGTGVAAVSSSIAVDGARVYIGVFKDSTVVHGGLWETDLNGGSAAPYTMPLDQVLAVRAVTSTLYYMSSAALRFVSSVSGAPADAAMLASPPVAFDVQGSNLVVATSANELRVCQTSPSASCVTTPAQVRMNAISAVIVDGSHMIWAEGGASGSIYRATLLAGAVPELLAEGQDSPVDLAVDFTTIYWANHGNAAGAGGAIMKLPK
jgi:hypothetical protein